MIKPACLKYKEYDKERQISETKRDEDERSDFERDRSRVIHSAAFRRLQGKTQLIAPNQGDFFRTRLTHSLEVAQVGKGLALKLGANTDLVETICLIHDLGHPPFGHAGEDELKSLMKDHGGFEANGQNIRLLTYLEPKTSKFYGLNLTRATLDGQWKYKKHYPCDTRKFYYQEDKRTLDWVSESIIIASKDKSFECQIMDWADEIAYAIHDLEDCIHAKLITNSDFSEFENNPLINVVIEDVAKSKLRWGAHSNSAELGWVRSVWDGLIADLKCNKPSFIVSTTLNERETSVNRKALTSFLIHRYISSTNRVVKSGYRDSDITLRYAYDTDIPVEMKAEVKLINGLIRTKVIESPEVFSLEQKGRRIIRELFQAYMQDSNSMKMLPTNFKEMLDDPKDCKQRARVVCDYIAGMTDAFAQTTYARLFLPNFGSVRDLL